MANFIGTSGKDSFIGSTADDNFSFGLAQSSQPYQSTLSGDDIVMGGLGFDTLIFSSGLAAISPGMLAGVSGIEHITLPTNDPSSLTINDAVLSANPGLSISGGNAAIDASSTTHGLTLSVISASGGSAPTGAHPDIRAGSGDDIITVQAAMLTPQGRFDGGAGQDELQIYDRLPGFTADLSGVRGIERVVLNSFIETGSHQQEISHGISVKITDEALDNNGSLLSIFGSDSNDTVNASSVQNATHGINVAAGAGSDILIGGAGRDYFHFAADQLHGDTVAGNGGQDILFLHRPDVTIEGDPRNGVITADDLFHVSGIEDIRLVDGGLSIRLDDHFAANNAPALAIYGSNGNDVIDASAVTLLWRGLNIAAGAGNDVLKGGAGIDSFHFDIGNLDANDIVQGGGGYDMLYLHGAGTVTANDLSGVSGIEKIQLVGDGASLYLDNHVLAANPSTLYGPEFDIFGSAGDDIIDLTAADSTSQRVRIDAGAGNDSIHTGSGGATIITGSGTDTILSGTGDDSIVWTGNGDLQRIDWISGFSSGQDKLVFNSAYFGFGAATFDTLAEGGFDTSLTDADLFRTDVSLANSGDLLSRLASNGTGAAGHALFVLAPDLESGRTMLYYTDDASGHGSAYALAALDLSQGASPIVMSDFAFM